MTAAADWKNTFGKLPHGRGVEVSPARRISPAPVCRLTTTTCRTPVCSSVYCSGGVTAFCGATEIGQGLDHVLVGCVAEDPVSSRFNRPVHRRHRFDAG